MEIKLIKSSWKRGAFDQNTYVIMQKNSAIIIDAGASVESVFEAVGKRKIEAVFITHCHLDHICYIEDYGKQFHCPIYINKQGESFLTDPNLNASQCFKMPRTYSVDNLCVMQENQKFTFGDINLTAIYTPGHTADGTCFLVEDESCVGLEKVLFTGDTIFANGVGRVDLATGSEEQLRNSIYKILSLDFNEIYPGHGEKTTKKIEIDYLQFLF